MPRSCWLLTFSLAGVLFLPAWGAELDVEALVKKSIAATEQDWQAAPKYQFRERDVKGKGTQTFQIYVIDGSQYNKLVARNDEPLSATEQKAEDTKLAQEIDRRKGESAEQRAKRIAKYQREREDDHLMLREMGKAFTYKLVGEETIHGRPVYVLEAIPDPSYRPVNARAKVLTHMRGKLWIDKAETQWVHVEAEVTAPVSMFMVAKVNPGTQFVLEQTRVAPNIWLPKRFQMKAKATVFGFRHDEMDDETYSDYQPHESVAELRAGAGQQ